MQHHNTAISGPFDDYLTKQQFCSAAPGGQISERTADRWHTLRIGPPRVKCGRRVLYSKKAVLEWLTANVQAPVRMGSK